MWTVNPDIFLSGGLKKSSPVLYLEYCIQDGNLDACSVTNTPREVLGTRVNPDTCRTRVHGQIRFESGKKKLRIQKYPDTCGLGLNDTSGTESLINKGTYRPNIPKSEI